MDPLDVLMNKSKVLPYYQPIVSADNQMVVAYDVLARYEGSEGEESLGWFFHDASIPDEYRLELEDHVQTLALEHYLAGDDHLILCLKYNGVLLAKTNGENVLKRLEFYQEQGLDLTKVIIGIKEEQLDGHLDDLKHVFMYFQSLGIRMSIDDVGLSETNLDRLALLKPNIVKVNLERFHEEAFSQMYQEVHHSLSMLTRKIGATLLFEGISQFNQLNYAWRNGGRYYQGLYLAPPRETFVDRELCKEKLQKDFHHFIVYERKKMEAQLQLTEKANQQLRITLKRIEHMTSYDEMVLAIAQDCDEFAFRVYITDGDGFQQSSNTEKDENGEWKLRGEGRYKNWSWRPYFLENIVRMNYEKRGILSDLYTDIQRDERIRTYAYPIKDNLYVYLDIPYQYLFEQDGLI
ncbi:EAL domain-containing protein [Halalkalibacterium halodurans]|uniref:EAL domain-containing protein n=1 Tax=Halalkalibacterium halodurans TaxID=86665 RepID=UPI002AAA1715|nr:EAL-associated domain-containing protein [Halalkalibacterium halodurans]MDY7222828.1 EAL-associated domain-containing protein [Halalkalibacterium halodurans]MDY7242049.1 EAL-associated domain-containing protein [Halalkalibacterium halodurans]